MAQNKTVETQSSVADYLSAIKDDKRRKDCKAIIELIAEHTSLEPKMWGTAIVGFGIYHYKYDSGHSGTAPLVGLASRANAITLYFSNTNEKAGLLKKLGKHKTSKACVYIQKLEDVNIDILAELAKNSVEYMQSKYPA